MLWIYASTLLNFSLAEVDDYSKRVSPLINKAKDTWIFSFSCFFV